MRRSLAILLPILVGVATVVLLVSFTSNPARILPALVRIHFWAVPAALALHAGAHLAWAIRMKVMAKGLGHPLQLRRSLKAVMAGLFAAELTPGRVGGEALRSVMVSRGAEKRVGATIVAADRSLDYLFFAGLAPVVALLIPAVYGTAPLLNTVALTVFTGSAVVLVLLVLIMRAPRLARAFARSVLASLIRVAPKRGPHWSERLLDAAGDVRRGLLLLMAERKRFIALGFALTLLTWGLEFTVPWILLQGLGFPVAWTDTLLAASLVTFISSIPISLGSAGVAELTMFATVRPWVPQEIQAAAFVLLWRLLTYGYDLLTGGALMVHEARRRR